ncbi:MAG: enoyl-CoA hydratase/isomerase family protein [Elusimicrobia bacterium]|nr:enoyl-CoA hydratase/isomerase family protein [Elusimicrobiota bacterium]MDE2236815.1 enoyl-CoA hydratase/isomerase family protein [Elusimicrobiota bacterium]MDE2426117.1 enoyl-CoA hydratase/isomerase family protein [Elusimicrobiota bacterium]
MGYEHILVEDGPLACVRLNRPKLRNAMSDVTLRELAQAFRGLSASSRTRCVLVRGEGPDFCAGADVEWMRRSGRLSREEGRKDARLLADALSAVSDCPVPVIVAAHGNVFGGGLGLLAACDIALLSDDARLSFSECRLGILPAVISCWVLPKIGERARRYYLTGERFTAEQACRMGLAGEALPAGELDARAKALAEEVLQCGPRAVRTAKALLARLGAEPRPRQIELAIDALVELRSSAEGQEGLAAFLEKRPPSWKRAASGGR